MKVWCKKVVLYNVPISFIIDSGKEYTARMFVWIPFGFVEGWIVRDLALAVSNAIYIGNSMDAPMGCLLFVVRNWIKNVKLNAT